MKRKGSFDESGEYVEAMSKAEARAANEDAGKFLASYIQNLEEKVRYWQADSAAAWDKCEERRQENIRLQTALDFLEKSLGKFIDEECESALRDYLVYGKRKK